MNNLLISEDRKGNEVFPNIELNAETGICSISGNSYMQDVRLFFKPVIEWFKEYTSTKRRGDLLVIYNLQNLNTGTSRVLYEILEILKSYKLLGANVKIKWNFIGKPEIHIDDIIDLTSDFGIDIEAITE
ncbi:MAG: DUF1987 domain-containing protein [Bacteroidales bacterium]|nr:DUF1987 domain-containing protein [Bacteroidales bacterium]